MLGLQRVLVVVLFFACLLACFHGLLLFFCLICVVSPGEENFNEETTAGADRQRSAKGNL